MSDRVQIQKNTSSPSQPARSPQFQQRPFTDERYHPVTSATTSADDAVEPKIARPRFNLMNMSIFPPAPGENIHSTEIQRQSEKEKEENLQLKAELKADALGEGTSEKNQNVELKAELDNQSSQSSACSDTIATSSSPKIARAGFSLMNIPIFPLTPGENIQSTGIQDQDEAGEKESEKSTELQTKAEGIIQTKCSQCEAESKEEKEKGESIQAKLTVGKPGDKYEQEADSMAAKVMAMPDEAVGESIQRQTDDENKEIQTSSVAKSIAPLVQRSANTTTQSSTSIESRLSNSKGGGSPLPDEVRSFMEPRFGADFSSVRVHTDSNAVGMNKELGAQAFAHGSDIYYGAGKSPSKDELTAHELTHTIQQEGLVARRFTNPLEKKENKLQRKLYLDRSSVLTPKILTKENGSASKNELRDTLQHEQQISNKEPHQETSIKSQEKDDRESILQTIWKGLIGDFEENPSLSSIGVNFLTSIIPGVDQIADLRDLAANLYFLVIKGQYSNPERWINLAFTLIGVVPVVGSVIKSASKVLYHKAAAQIIGNLGELLQPIRKLFPEIGNIRALQNLINREWSNWASFGKNKWQEILNNFYAKVNSLPDFIDFISGNKKKIFLDAISRVQQVSNSALAKAFNDIRRKIDEVLEELGRRLDPNGNLATANGAPLPNRVDDGIHRPARIEGSRGSSARSSRSRFLNVANPRDENLLSSIGEGLSHGNIELGQEFGRGGFGTIFEIAGHPHLVIKIATDSHGGINDQLFKEATNLSSLTKKGYPTVYKGLIEWVDPNGITRQGIVMEKVEGALSKRILRTGKFANEPVDTSLEALVTPKTLEDLNKFRQKAENDDIVIEDLQFMLSKKDGSIYLIDPARVEPLPSRGQQRREIKRQYLRRIDRIITQFSEILRNNQL